jgi:hypothetical protein
MLRCLDPPPPMMPFFYCFLRKHLKGYQNTKIERFNNIRAIQITMPSLRIKIEFPDDIAELLIEQSQTEGKNRQKIIQSIIEEHYSRSLALIPIISTDVQPLTVYTSQDIEAGFDSIIEKQSLRIQLEELQLRYQKLLEEHENLKDLYQISVSITRAKTKIKTPWWIRLKSMFIKKEERD